MSTSPFASHLATSLQRYYPEVKRRYPTEGRRRWRLRIAHQFWTAVGDTDLLPQQAISLEVTPVAEAETDPDPLDGVTRDGLELGLIIRTDFSDELAWTTFCTLLRDSEKDLVLDSGDVDKKSSEQSLQPNSEQDRAEDDSDTDSEGEGVPPVIFHIINPSSPQERELLANASNLAALRLFNDVDIRPSPTIPHGVKRIHPPNRLVDKHSWQEYYRGKNIWMYDTKSNTDHCVRVVSQSGDMYGTATGDSWRARVSHICEIQLNLSLGAIRIDFGGLDRWDFTERRRNMMEAEGQ